MLRLVVLVCLLSGSCSTGLSLDMFSKNNDIDFKDDKASAGGVRHTDPEVYMNATQLITSKGYPCEDFGVKTEDGFILGVQRIPHGRHDNSVNVNKPVVFLQHGLLGASTNWLTNLANESLAFILADAGFDVWLGNVRGNTYSRRHVTYKPSDKRFWAWSWDEMAKYDLPAMVNFALTTTGQQQLYYVGHSQGTLIMFAQLSENQYFKEKIKTFFALGPVATVEYIESPIRLFADLSTEIKDLFKLFGEYEFLPSKPIMKFLASTLCEERLTRKICENTMFLFGGFDSHQLNVSRIPVYTAHTPAGTSVQNMVHFAQMVESGLFQKYDYGSKKDNMKYYNQTTAPLYNATKVTAPVYLFSGQHDWLSDPWDVYRLKSQLPNLVYQEEVADWDHLDFLWAMDAAELVYADIVKFINKAEATSAPKSRG